MPGSLIFFLIRDTHTLKYGNGQYRLVPKLNFVQSRLRFFEESMTFRLLMTYSMQQQAALRSKAVKRPA